MVVPIWMEFIEARNGTSGAGSSSPVLEKCSNSSAKPRKRCRSSRPGGSISVESVFLMMDTAGPSEAIRRQSTGPDCQARNERLLKTALSSPKLGRFGALRSKTTNRRISTQWRGRHVQNRPILQTAQDRPDQEIPVMTTSSARKLLLGAAIAAGMGIGYAIGAQPHMSQSISLLQSARGELQAATPNKGGHRERA